MFQDSRCIRYVFAVTLSIFCYLASRLAVNVAHFRAQQKGVGISFVNFR